MEIKTWKEEVPQKKNSVACKASPIDFEDDEDREKDENGDHFMLAQKVGRMLYKK